MAEYSLKELYGGAITTKLPNNILDASQFRQVPDTQEVFVNPSENVSNYNEMVKDDSIIVDLMERLQIGDEVEALKEHFAEISSLNDTESNWKLLKTEKNIENLSGSKEALVGVGLEPALKWGRKENVADSEYKPTLVVVLGLIRLGRVDTDVLITYNVLFNNPAELQDLHELHETENVDPNNRAHQRIVFAIDVVRAAINNFKVESWNLFG